MHWAVVVSADRRNILASVPLARVPARPRRPARASTSPENRRKFPRIDADEAGLLQGGGSGPAAFHTPIRVRCVAPGGLRCEASDLRVARCERGAVVSLRFGDVRFPFVLPGKIAWMRRDGDVVVVGIELQLELAPAAMRQGYARWVVERLREYRR